MSAAPAADGGEFMDHDPTVGLPPRHPFLRTLGAVGLGILTFVLSGFIMGVLLHGRTEITRQKPWLVGVLNHGPMLVVSILIMLALSRGRLRSFGFRLPSRFPLGIALLIPAVASGLASASERLFHLSGLTFMKDYTTLQTVLLVWGLASVAEETLTRGLIQGFLQPVQASGLSLGRLRLSLPVLVSGFFFGAMHLMLRTVGIPWPTVASIVIFAIVIGLAAGWFRERSGSLLPAIMIHATANAVGTLIDLLLPK